LSNRFSSRDYYKKFLPSVLGVRDEIQLRADRPEDLVNGPGRFKEDRHSFRVPKQVRKQAAPIYVSEDKLVVHDLGDLDAIGGAPAFLKGQFFRWRIAEFAR